MAFTSTFIRQIPIGPDCVEVLYSFASTGGSAGGEVDASAYLVSAQHADGTAATDTTAVQCVLDSSSAGKVTITTAANATGTIRIIGQPKRS